MDLPTSLQAKTQGRRFHGPPPAPIEFPKWIKVEGKDVLALTAEHEAELTVDIRESLKRQGAVEREAVEAAKEAAAAAQVAERETADKSHESASEAEVENLLSAPEKRGPGRPRIVRPDGRDHA